eukprot:TRINITY_DN1937_c0_g1_i1.p1 TRINITY_DN1937_c0_g1~~TRINITY_DN1937_c0_g1_i1.p1  ORF type:complete len:185 (+),score=47.05 TRINITY_DN1937_c0_g1_i1:347-901(+)
MSKGYSIASRNVSKCASLTSHCVMATSGMEAEAITLRKVLDYKIVMYEHNNHKEMPVPSVAQMLSTTLYYKRFFPYYTFNLICGVDEKGESYVYGYDAIGSFERLKHGACGSGSALVTSILDNQVDFKQQPQNKKDLSQEEAIDLIKDALVCADERDIYTGDSADLFIITKDGIKKDKFELRKD